MCEVGSRGESTRAVEHERVGIRVSNEGLGHAAPGVPPTC